MTTHIMSITRSTSAAVIAALIMESDKGHDPKTFVELRVILYNEFGISEYTDAECTILDNELARYSISHYGGEAMMCQGREDGFNICKGIDANGKLVLGVYKYKNRK